MITHAAFPKRLLYCFIGPLPAIASFSEKEKGAVQGGFLGCNCVKNRDNCTSLLDFPDEI